MHIFYARSQAKHAPAHEFFDGRMIPYQESPQRIDMILAALARAGFNELYAPRDHGMAPIEAIHSSAYLTWLQEIYADWIAFGGPASGAVCDTFAMPGLPHHPVRPRAAMGRFALDATSVIQAHTWQAAYDAAQSAICAADHVFFGAHAAYALCRPPGHHAHAGMCGGYCFLNNAAIAAQRLRANGHPRVTVLDVDFHHGNGTQDIFYQRPDVQFVSLHADPERQYPYYSGARSECGVGAGLGSTCNFPLPAGCDDALFLATLDRAAGDIRAFAPTALVVSLGLDTFAGDPLGDFALTRLGFCAIGQQIAKLDLPCVFVQEGGYAISDLGLNVVATLTGFVQQTGERMP